MEPILHIDLDARITSGEPLRLDLGCGPSPRAGHIGIDRLDLPGVDIVANAEAGLPFLPDNSVDEIYSKSFLEHVDDVENLLREVRRVLKPEGQAYFFVPHFSNPYYYHDYTHRSFFGLHSFSYFAKPEQQHLRKVPAFYSEVRFRIERVRIEFKSNFAALRPLKKLMTALVNSSRLAQAVYEENFVWTFPAYGLHVWLKPDKSLPPA